MGLDCLCLLIDNYDMSDMYIRDVDSELMREAKAHAALSGTTLREYVIEVLRKDLKERQKSSRGKAPRK